MLQAYWQCYERLNLDQHQVFDHIVSAITRDPMNAWFFLHSPGGTGRSISRTDSVLLC